MALRKILSYIASEGACIGALNSRSTVADEAHCDTRYIEHRVLRSKTPTLKRNRAFSASSATQYGEYRIFTYF